MKICNRCNESKEENQYYSRDSSCKECRKRLVRENRAKNADYYREYDKSRYQNDPRVRARHKDYASTNAGVEATNRAKNKWISLNPVKRAAHIILGNAVKNGVIKKPGFCEKCKGTGRIHGHHCDYAKPLDVMWLCPQCHVDWHKDNGEGKNPN